MGLGDGTGQKKPCHHLGQFFSNFLPQKILGYLKEFLRKKLKSAKKVTKLPALTELSERTVSDLEPKTRVVIPFSVIKNI